MKDVTSALRTNEQGTARELRRTLVRDVMTTQVVSVGPEDTFDEVARTLRNHGVRAVPVLGGGGVLLGVVSEADLMKTTGLGDPERAAPQGRWHRGGGAWDRPRTARALMSAPVITVAPSASVGEAARLMHERKLGWLAVVDQAPSGEERLAGVLGRSDLLAMFDRDDTDLRDEIVDSLRTRLSVTDPRQIAVHVHHGVVTLSGHLPSLAEARLVTEFVERLEGVVALIHGLTYDVDTTSVPRDRAPVQWMS